MNKVLRITALFVFFFTLLFSEKNRVFAAKKRIRQAASAVKSVGYSSVKISRPTHSIVISFINLSNVKKASYTLSYNASGIDQGVVGSLVPSGSSESRDLYFGTCSKGVCTPHTNISRAALVITTSLKSGGSTSKRYTIRF
ncbi:hypothetical protein HY947_05070 [Candidatus Gottesmanbacteria bacterium]|nr:hypothetical protein [Candidatus Gottesmanbacteria bacterium]